jgi:hypothetical protein
MNVMYLRHALAILLVCGHAFADDASARAQALFENGKTLLKAGAIEEACAKFDASRKLESAPGTLFALGACYEKQGRLASARAAFLDSEALAAQVRATATETKAKQRAASLEARVPKITIMVTGSPADLTLTRAGVPVERAEWGAVVPMDPGSYVWRATQPGHAPWETTLTVVEGKDGVLQVPELAKAEEPAKEPVRAPRDSTPPPVVTVPPKKVTQERPSSSLSTIGIVVTSVGVAGLGFGGFAAYLADSTWNAPFDSRQCILTGARLACTASGSADVAEAKTWATVSTTAFIAGGALTLGGLLMYALAPKSSPILSVTAQVSGNAAAIQVSGSLR